MDAPTWGYQSWYTRFTYMWNRTSASPIMARVLFSIAENSYHFFNEWHAEEIG